MLTAGRLRAVWGRGVEGFENAMPHCYWWARVHLLDWWAAFIRPRVAPGWQEVGSRLSPGYTILFSITPAGPVIERVFDTATDVLVRRSWLLPWRRFYYLDLVDPAAVRSVYHMLQHVPGYLLWAPFDGLVPVPMTPQQTAEAVQRTLQMGWAAEAQPWYRPAQPLRATLA